MGSTCRRTEEPEHYTKQFQKWTLVQLKNECIKKNIDYPLNARRMTLVNLLMDNENTRTITGNVISDTTSHHHEDTQSTDTFYYKYFGFRPNTYKFGVNSFVDSLNITDKCCEYNKDGYFSPSRKTTPTKARWYNFYSSSR